MSNYFDVEAIINTSPHTRVFNIVGQGGVGKSYSVKRFMLKEWFDNGTPFVYVKRWTTEVQGSALATVFTDVETDPELVRRFSDFDKGNHFTGFHVMVKSGYFWLVGEAETGSLTYIKEVGKIACVSKATSFKGGTYNNYRNILFDEFIDERYVHGRSEPSLLDKIVNTVARAGNDVRIFLCGNPDYAIEMNPYLEQLRLDYDHLQSNTVYYYDTKTPEGKILADNVMFIKLANYNNMGGGFLNEHTSNVWHTPEGEMRITGEVKTNRYMRIPEDVAAYEPLYELVIETAVQTTEEYNRKIYAYVGIYDDDTHIWIFRHRKRELSDKVDYKVFCRYDDLKLRRHDCDVQILRLRIPDAPELRPLGSLLRAIDVTRLIFSEDDQVATLYETIRNTDI